MIGYAFLVLIAGIVVIVGSIVVGVAVWGWGQEKKIAQAKELAELAKTENTGASVTQPS